MKNKYTIKNDKVLIHLNKGHTAMIDLADLPVAKSIGTTWYLHVNTKTGKGYVVCNTLPDENGRRKWVKLHRLIMGVTDPDVHVDHRDGNTLDNTRHNLRTVTQAQNNQNIRGSRIGSRTGVRGVGVSPNGTYRVRVSVGGKKKYIGTYKTLEEAEQAAIEARKVLLPYSEE